MRQFLTLIAIAFLFFSCDKEDGPWQLASPDGQVRVEVNREAPGAGPLSYSVYLREGEAWKMVLEPSPLGIEREDAAFTDSLQFLSDEVRKNQEEAYTLRSGGRKEHRHVFNEITLAFENQDKKAVHLVFRIYNNGVAFRYRFPEESGEAVRVVKEHTAFHLGEGNFWGHPYDTVTKWNPAYETFFAGPLPIGAEAPRNKNGWAFPLLFETNGSWVFISESGFDGAYPGSHLHGNCEGGLYTLKFAEAEEAMGYYDNAPHSTLPWKTPWRFIIVGKSPGDIAAAHLATALAAPSRLENVDWVRPGRSSWSWWSDSDSPQDYERLVPFIDFAADMGWEYSLVDANWNRMQNGALEQLAEYAAGKGVGLLAWYNSGGKHNVVEEAPRDLMDNREVRRREFERISRLGIKGIKVDFFQSDKQDVLRLYLDILADAADYNLVVNFHGCTLPRGWRRTYPNLLSMEAVRGGECYKFDASYPEKAPAHLAIVPFTRSVMGPTDYTPGGFSDNTYPHLTTYGFELALPIVLESGIIHYVDTPEKIQSLPPFAVELLKELPADWDDTRCLAGYPGRDAVFARRKGDKWYIGGINGEGEEKNITLGLSGIAPEGATIALITDGREGSLGMERRAVAEGRLEVKMQPYGGFVATVE
ncbi:MAG: glycoside hydrolase family 97 catalytic domain-containing protein [Phaeodactylibacter sp.]|nr:glycoside hydrolase family 97 catalytic domain-containing protein [Phaeodactylibacter sp.]